MEQPPRVEQRDIVLSYAREDRGRVAALAQELEKQGWSVWWDIDLLPGEEFDERIERMIGAAKCLVVLWSRASVASRWVRSEAASAWEQDKLLPVRIDEVKVPIPFNRLHSADLVGWPALRDPEQVRGLLSAVAGAIGKAPPAGQPQRGGPSLLALRLSATLLVLALGMAIRGAFFAFQSPFSPALLVSLASVLAALLPVWGGGSVLQPLFRRVAGGAALRLAVPLLLLGLAGGLTAASWRLSPVFDLQASSVAAPVPASVNVNLRNHAGGVVFPREGFLVLLLDTRLGTLRDFELEVALEPYGYVEFAELLTDRALAYSRTFAVVPSSDGKGRVRIKGEALRGAARVWLRWKRPAEVQTEVAPPRLEARCSAGRWQRRAALELTEN